LHPDNIYKTSYDFNKLILNHPPLATFVFTNQYKNKTIDFSSNEAVLHLNKALLITYHNVADWNIPNGYLCPPIPGRLDYLLHIKDFLNRNNISKNITGLDIGVGANCIYPILAHQFLNWKMIGADIDEVAVSSATKNASLLDGIEIRKQKSKAHIFENIIIDGEYYDFTMCNPPFHTSEKEATKGSLRKLKNLKGTTTLKLNFGGQANELWCNGGEALFIKKMIRESFAFKKQVNWFTTLVSKKENLKAIYKQLDKLKAIHTTVAMEQGNKKSRFVAWKFPLESF